jgi:hypothetical protein
MQEEQELTVAETETGNLTSEYSLIDRLQIASKNTLQKAFFIAIPDVT